jgi:hypothetical protein
VTLARLMVLAVSAAAALAWADVPPRDSIGCREKALGDACKRDDGSTGTCVKDTCTRNDYSNGPPPKQVPYDCLRCAAEAVPSAPPAEAAPKKSSCAAVTDLSLAALGAWLVLRRRRPAS